MSVTDPFNRLSGAQRTLALVGRRRELEQAAERLAAPVTDPQTLAFWGEGGIGKTRLLEEMLAAALRAAGQIVAAGVVDLYHSAAHTSNGLADAIYAKLANAVRFPSYEQERRSLERMLLAGEVTGVADQRTKALEAFDADLGAASASRRVVIALDTAERLVYDSELDLEHPAQVAEAFDWLCARLPSWRNVVILIAGRAAARPLFKRLQERCGVAVHSFELHPLTDDEADQYFRAAAAEAAQRGNVEIAQRIESFVTDDEMRRRAIYAAGGRPILLALLLDLLTVGAGSDIRRILEETRHDRRLSAMHEFERQLVARIKELTGIGDIIDALGRAPKGVDAALLALLLKVSKQDAEEHLNGVRDLSFVKVRPDDERFFLHDEMYAMLKRGLYGSPADAQYMEEAYATISRYYDERHVAILHELDEHWATVEREGQNRLNVEKLVQLNTQRQDNVTEHVYYRLRHEPARGLEHWQRRSHEAVVSGDILLDVQLLAELISFVAGDQELDAADRALARVLIAVHGAPRAWVNQQYKEMSGIIAEIRQADAGVLDAAAPLATACLGTWKAYTLGMTGDGDGLDEAQALHDATIEALGGWLRCATANTIPEGQLAATPLTVWSAKLLFALAHRGRGYLHWERGWMEQSVRDFRTAAEYWRDLDLRVEMAMTLNDMGFSMAEQGKYADARALVEDALELRQSLGYRSPVGLSENTLALIDLREGRYEAARQLSQRALTIFRALVDRRSAGLALNALSEATRRLASAGKGGERGQRVALLREARDHAREAHIIFSELGESLRQAEALLELGCACRDWVDLLRRSGSLMDPIADLIRESITSLQKAADIAAEAHPHLALDAIVDMAWLGYYAQDQAIQDEAAAKAEKLIPEEYRLQRVIHLPAEVREEKFRKVLWPQIGKLHAMRGHEAFHQYRGKYHHGSGQNDRQPLDPDAHSLLLKAAQEFWLCLQYSVLYAEDYHNLRREKDRMYRSLRILNRNEIEVISEGVEEQESLLQVSNSVMREFLENRALLPPQVQETL